MDLDCSTVVKLTLMCCIIFRFHSLSLNSLQHMHENGSYTNVFIHSYSAHSIRVIHPLLANASSKRFQSVLTSQRKFFHARVTLCISFLASSQDEDIATQKKMTLKNKEFKIGLGLDFLCFSFSTELKHPNSAFIKNAAHWFHCSQRNLNAA